jgi:hypothetical protein
MAEIHFWYMEASQNKSDATIQLLIGSLVVLFAGISYVSCSVQKLLKNFSLATVKNFFFNFWADMTPERFSES